MALNPISCIAFLLLTLATISFARDTFIYPPPVYPPISPDYATPPSYDDEPPVYPPTSPPSYDDEPPVYPPTTPPIYDSPFPADAFPVYAPQPSYDYSPAYAPYPADEPPVYAPMPEYEPPTSHPPSPTYM